MIISQVQWVKLDKQEESLSRVPVSEGSLDTLKVQLLIDQEKQQLTMHIDDDIYVAELSNLMAQTIVAACPELTTKLAIKAAAPREETKTDG